MDGIRYISSPDTFTDTLVSVSPIYGCMHMQSSYKFQTSMENQRSEGVGRQFQKPKNTFISLLWRVRTDYSLSLLEKRS